MSIRAIDAASRLQLEPRDKFVLIALANYANDEHKAWPKHQSLADFTGYSRMTVIRALESLALSGLIRRANRYSGGHQQSNMYTLVFLVPDEQGNNQSVAESQDDTQQGNNVIPPESQADTPRVTTSSKAESQSVTHNRHLEPPIEPSLEPTPPTPPTIHSNDEGAKPEKDKNPKPPPFDPTTLDLPPFVDEQTWLDFCTHRKEMKAKLTPKAAELTLKKLRQYPEFANQMLENTITNSWRGVFPPRQGQAPQDSARPRVGDEICNFGEWYKITEVLPDGSFFTECPSSGHVPSKLAEFGNGFRRCPN